MRPGREVYVTLPHGACSERETSAEDKVGEGGDVLGSRELPACGDTGDSSVSLHVLGVFVLQLRAVWAKEEETGRIPVTILPSQAMSPSYHLIFASSFC